VESGKSKNLVRQSDCETVRQANRKQEARSKKQEARSKKQEAGKKKNLIM